MEVFEETINKAFVKEKDNIHPDHYSRFTHEPIEVIKDWGLDFDLGNCVKYIARAPYKGKHLEDLEKAKYYLEHEIAWLKNNLPIE